MVLTGWSVVMVAAGETDMSHEVLRCGVSFSEGRVALRERGGGREMGRSRGRETGWDVFYERRIYFQ